MDELQEDHSTLSTNLPAERRRIPQNKEETDSSPYFRPSTAKTSDIQTSQDQSNSAPRPKKRQGQIAISDGKLWTKKPLVNPVPKDDPGRKSNREVAAETWELLPGLLATRPDVTNASFLCQREHLDPDRCPRLPATKVEVFNMDTVDTALSLIDDPPQHPVAILNLANADHPGGGWENGAVAQEECICFRTSLAKTLHKKHYPIPDDGVIYSPTVLVFRDNMKNGHGLLDLRDPSQLDVISVISCAGLYHPSLKQDANGDDTYKHDRDARITREKLRIILRTAIRNKHQQIVLGAIGCGVFGNPKRAVAQMWADVLQEKEFQGGYWKDVVFAVMSGGKPDNYKVFKEILHGLVLN